MVNRPKANPELLAKIRAMSEERDAHMKTLYENETSTQKQHRQNYYNKVEASGWDVAED